MEVNDLLSSQYSVNKNIRCEISMLGPDLRDYSDAYIVVKRKIKDNDEGDNNDKKRNKKLK